MRTWLLILARYKALDYRRKISRKNLLEFDKFSDNTAADCSVVWNPEEQLVKKETHERIQAALNSMLPSEKELLYRRYFLEESIDSIAADLGISRGVVDSRLWRARRSLKRLLHDKNNKGGVING